MKGTGWVQQKHETGKHPIGVGGQNQSGECAIAEESQCGAESPSKFSGHSFRRGAASSAAAAGLRDFELQQVGRWRSDAHKLYIEPNPYRLLSLSSRLHWAVPDAQPFRASGSPCTMCMVSSSMDSFLITKVPGSPMLLQSAHPSLLHLSESGHFLGHD